LALITLLSYLNIVLGFILTKLDYVDKLDIPMLLSNGILAFKEKELEIKSRVAIEEVATSALLANHLKRSIADEKNH